MSSSVNKAEIGKFSKDAGRWWDEHGPFAPLHALNPARLGYIKAQICGHFDLDEAGLKPFKDLTVLDIGCGGGLVCEPMARMGAEVTGIDADPVAIEVAKEHAAQSELKIHYQCTSAESLLMSSPGLTGGSRAIGKRSSAFAEDDRMWDVVLALEIIEHVEDPAEFVKTCAKLAKPGGLVIFSTLNRTVKSFAFGIVAAEYILNMVPRGTHDWKKFIRPSELTKHARAADLVPKNISGLTYSPTGGDFRVSKTDMGVNYFLSAAKP